MATETRGRPRTRRGAAQREAISNALVLASVTAVLKNLLENGLVDRGVTASIGGDTIISALPPDRITTGQDERAQINLFLYEVKPKGLDHPSRFAPADGTTRTPASSLAFELFYLLTAYGAQDFQIEILLGYALELLRENPVLMGDAVRTIFASVASTEGGRVVLPALAALAESDLAERIQQIKVSPQVLNPDEMARLWSSLQARYRPSAAYKIAVFVLDGHPGESA